jgi:hypothetical protein
MLVCCFVLTAKEKKHYFSKVEESMKALQFHLQDKKKLRKPG